MDTKNHLNKIFVAFYSLNRVLFASFCLVDTFPNHFSFHLVNQKDADAKIAYQNKLENIYKDFSINQDTILIISDASIKNNIATSVSYI